MIHSVIMRSVENRTWPNAWAMSQESEMRWSNQASALSTTRRDQCGAAQHNTKEQALSLSRGGHVSAHRAAVSRTTAQHDARWRWLHRIGLGVGLHRVWYDAHATTRRVHEAVGVVAVCELIAVVVGVVVTELCLAGIGDAVEIGVHVIRAFGADVTAIGHAVAICIEAIVLPLAYVTAIGDRVSIGVLAIICAGAHVAGVGDVVVVGIVGVCAHVACIAGIGDAIAVRIDVIGACGADVASVHDTVTI